METGKSYIRKIVLILGVGVGFLFLTAFFVGCTADSLPQLDLNGDGTDNSGGDGSGGTDGNGNGDGSGGSNGDGSGNSNGDGSGDGTGGTNGGGGATGSSGPDADNDTVADELDVDDDNDGLIEIYTLAQFNAIRYNLAGTGYSESAIATPVTLGAPTAATAHCDTDTNGLYLCGYELMNDLDFDTDGDGSTVIISGTIPTAVADAEDTYHNGGAGWEPIGICSGDDACSAPFTGVFEGNGHTIANLFISHSGTEENSGTGLFGGATNRIQNLRLTAVYVVNEVDEDDNIGSVAGYGKDLAVHNVSAEGFVQSTLGANTYDVGGLVGDGQGSTISASRFYGSVIGSRRTGGLVGFGAAVIGSYAAGADDDSITGIGRIGGLVGQQDSGLIVASYATNDVAGGATTNTIGGLVGYQDGGMITASYATGDVDGNSGFDFVGGLVGYNGSGTAISASYATGDVDGGDGSNDRVGSLLGLQLGTATASYGFGSLAGQEFAGLSPTLPAGVTVPAELTAENTGWNTAAGGLNAWDFGDSTQTPALRFADYDGEVGIDDVDYCGTVIPDTLVDGSAVTCDADGTLLPGQR